MTSDLFILLGLLLTLLLLVPELRVLAKAYLSYEETSERVERSDVHIGTAGDFSSAAVLGSVRVTALDDPTFLRRPLLPAARPPRPLRTARGASIVSETSGVWPCVLQYRHRSRPLQGHEIFAGFYVHKFRPENKLPVALRPDFLALSRQCLPALIGRLPVTSAVR